MSKKPTYKELTLRVDELEEQIKEYQSEAIKYRTLFSTFPHGITVSDEQGRILETNTAAEQMLGLDKKELKKRSISSKQWKIFRPDGSIMPKSEWPCIISLRDNRLISNYEIGVLRLNNELIWLNVSAAPLPIEGFGIVATCSDITDKRKSEKALRDSEEKYRQLTSLSPGGIYLIDINGDCVYANKTWLEMAGMTYEEAMGKGWINGIHPDDRKHACQSWYEMVKSQGTWGDEYRFVSSQGKITWVYGYAAPIRDDGVNIIGYLGINVDITDRKRMECELKKYQNIVSSTPDAIAYLDRDYRYIIVNDAYESFSGLKREQLIDMTVAEYLGEDVFRQIVKERFDICLKGETVTYQEWFEYPTLGRRFVEVSYYPYRDTHNQISGVIANTRDITDRKLSDEAILRKDKELENQALHLQEVNIALKVLLDQRQNERKALEENLYANVQKLILPHLNEVKQITREEQIIAYMDIVESNLNDIISPLARNLSSIHLKLTSKELQVCNLIKQGKTSKEIASLLNVSTDAISVHRYRIRKKLGLLKTKTNLRAYLQNITN